MAASAPVPDVASFPRPCILHDPQTTLAMLLALVRQLQGVIQAEGTLLRELRLDRLRQLQAEKADLVAGYGSKLRQLRQAPGIWVTLSDEDRRLLEAAIRGLQTSFRGQATRRSLVRAAVNDVARAIDESIGDDADHGCDLVLRPRVVPWC